MNVRANGKVESAAVSIVSHSAVVGVQLSAFHPEMHSNQRMPFVRHLILTRRLPQHLEPEGFISKPFNVSLV